MEDLLAEVVGVEPVARVPGRRDDAAQSTTRARVERIQSFSGASLAAYRQPGSVAQHDLDALRGQALSRSAIAVVIWANVGRRGLHDIVDPAHDHDLRWTPSRATASRVTAPMVGPLGVATKARPATATLRDRVAGTGPASAFDIEIESPAAQILPGWDGDAGRTVVVGAIVASVGGGVDDR